MRVADERATPRIPLMELRQMRYAVAVADASHFGRAAEQLRISQSGLSQQIRALERTLGVNLFVRNTRSVTLTPAGRAFVEQARAVLELADRAVTSARSFHEGPSGLVKLATFSPGVPRELTELLERYGEVYPNVQVDLHPGLTSQNIEALRQRRVDIAMVVRPFESPETPRYLRLGWSKLLVVMSSKHPLASLDEIPRDELVRQSFLTMPRSFNPPLIDHFHDLLFGNRERPPMIEAVDIAPIPRLLRIANDPGLLGIGFANEPSTKVPGVTFRSVERPEPQYEYGLAWFATHASPLLDDLIALAREVTGDIEMRAGDE